MTADNLGPDSGSVRRTRTLALMLAVVWHWWIGFALSVGTILTVLGVVVGYFMKVENPRYPRKP